MKRTLGDFRKAVWSVNLWGDLEALERKSLCFGPAKAGHSRLPLFSLLGLS